MLAKRYRLKLATCTVVREPGQPSPRRLSEPEAVAALATFSLPTIAQRPRNALEQFRVRTPCRCLAVSQHVSANPACEFSICLRIPLDKRRKKLERLMCRLRRLDSSLERGEYVRRDAQAGREVRQEGVGARLGQAPSDVDGLLAGGERLLPAPEIGEPVAEVAEAPGEVRQEGVGARLSQAPIDVDGLLAGRERLLPAPESGEPVPRLVRLPARSGKKASGRVSARRLRISTAS